MSKTHETLIEQEAQQHSRLKPLCRVVGDLTLIPQTDSFNYRVERSRCCTHEAVLDWVQHLPEKTWVTRQHIRQFIECCEQSGWIAPIRSH